MEFPAVDLGALTIPAFATIFGAGWLACHKFIVTDLKARLEIVENRMREIELENRAELQKLRERLLGNG